MNKCTFNPEELHQDIGVMQCPSCGHLVIPGQPHPTSEQPVSDSELERLAAGNCEHEKWVQQYAKPETSQVAQ